MKKSWKVLLNIRLAAVLLLSVWPGIADFGDFGGDSDYGGGSDWGSSHDSGRDWDYSSGRRSRSSGSGSGNGSGLGPAVLVYLIISGIILVYKFKHPPQKKQTGSGTRKKIEPTWGFLPRMLLSIPPEADWQPAREKEAFEDLYRRMQDAWGAGDMTPLRGDFTPEAYAQFERQLQAKNARGEHAHCKVISVSATPEGWNENAHEWMLAVTVRAVIKAWNTNDNGDIVSGSSLAEKSMVYAWVLRKPKNTAEGKLHCPNCGAEVEMEAGTECPMCGAQLEAPGKGWQLSSIQGLSQKTLP